jgi:serine phosphatase RsbU (regulator of sigma subunit)
MQSRRNAEDRVTFATFGRPCSGERLSGDIAVVERKNNTCFIAIADVLGHGPEANALARRISAFLRTGWQTDIVATLVALHNEILGTRGAAVGACVLDERTGVVRYAAVGNTVMRIFGLGNPDIRTISVPGIIGEIMRTPREQTIQLEPSSTIVLYTDGVKDRFRLDDYPQLTYEGVWVAAKTLVERYRNNFDDATCIVLRWNP